MALVKLAIFDSIVKQDIALNLNDTVLGLVLFRGVALEFPLARVD